MGVYPSRVSRYSWVALTPVEYTALTELVANGCRIFRQRGKRRLNREQEPLTLNNLDKNRLYMPDDCDSLGLELSSLPNGVAIIDMDMPMMAGLLEEAMFGLSYKCSLEQTPSGGLHIWGRLLFPVAKATHFACGVPIELFSPCSNKRMTLWGVGRKLSKWIPLSELGLLTGAFEPVSGLKQIEIACPIPEGSRWNALYQQVMKNPSLSEETLRMQAAYLCEPSFDEPKLEDLAKRVREREPLSIGNQKYEALKSLVLAALIEILRGRWIYRLPDHRWYKYKTEGYWTFEEGSLFELLNEIGNEIDTLKMDYAPEQARKMSTLGFRKLMEDNLKGKLHCEPKSVNGLHFVNGFLEYKEDDYAIVPPLPGFWLFSRCNIPLYKETKLTPIQKEFLFDLTSGDKLKLNVIRAFLKLLFTQNNKEQICLYLWGSGATGKSTFNNLLHYILGDSCCTLDLLRVTNRFEMRVIYDKSLILMSDIPKTANQMQCLILKRIISGDAVVGEIKNGLIFPIEPRGVMLVTANAIWETYDKTSGFRRRFCYLLTPRVAQMRDSLLLEKLKKDADGLITWALSMPSEYTRIGQYAEEISEAEGGEAPDPSGLMTWIQEKVRYLPRNKIPLGARKTPQAGSLYESYIELAELYGVVPLEWYTFGDHLMDQLRTLGYTKVKKGRGNKGYYIEGLTLDKKGERLARKRDTSLISALRNVDPWEGFGSDSSFDPWEDQEMDDPAEDIVDCEVLDAEEALTESNKAPWDLEADTSVREHTPPVKARKSPLEGLTPAEQAQTEAFLSDYPDIRHLYETEGGRPWTQKEVVDIAVSNLIEDPSGRDVMVREYKSYSEELSPSALFFPSHLSLSTTMMDDPYPQAGEMEACVQTLRALPGRYPNLLLSLKTRESEIIRMCYMLFRLFLPGDTTYYRRRCPIGALFAESYEESQGYPRIKPRSGESLASIANIKRECKSVIKEVFRRIALPEGLWIEEFDMMACHTGIFTGLMGPNRAPNTWDAYRSGNFWGFVMDKWDHGIPKPLLKTIFYAGLNGASLKGNGAIRKAIMARKYDLTGDDSEICLHRAVQHPIVVELAKFLGDIGGRRRIYLPTKKLPYYGGVDESNQGRKGSNYHAGLMSSRTFTSHELVLLMAVTEGLILNGLGWPISLENDGLLVLSDLKSGKSGMVDALNKILSKASQDFLGVSMFVESKD